MLSLSTPAAMADEGGEKLDVKSDKGSDDGKEPKAKQTVTEYLGCVFHAMFLEKPILSLLHVFLPPALYWQFTTRHDDDFNQMLLFAFSMLALVPQCERLGFLTDQLCLHLGQTVAGLINVTAGNLPELIVVIVALFHSNKPLIVQESLIGGVLSNLLLVQGLSLFAGGLRHKVQTFNTTFSSTLLTALFLMSLIIALVTTLPEHMQTVYLMADDRIESVKDRDSPAREISHCVAIFAFLFYVCFLVFSLKTHADLIEEGDGDDDDDDDDDEDILGLTGSIVVLTVLMAVVSLVCDGLVDAVEGTARASHLSELFIVAIILPNVNNAPEHLVAVRMAWNNKLDAVMAIAVGSSAQLGLFLLPVGVMLDWARGGTLDLNTKPIVALGVMLAVVFSTVATASGKSTWILGIALLACYMAIAMAWFYAPVTSQIFCPDPCVEYIRLTNSTPPTAHPNMVLPPVNLTAANASETTDISQPLSAALDLLSSSVGEVSESLHGSRRDLHALNPKLTPQLRQLPHTVASAVAAAGAKAMRGGSALIQPMADF